MQFLFVETWTQELEDQTNKKMSGMEFSETLELCAITSLKSCNTFAEPVNAIKTKTASLTQLPNVEHPIKWSFFTRNQLHRQNHKKIQKEIREFLWNMENDWWEKTANWNGAVISMRKFPCIL